MIKITSELFGEIQVPLGDYEYSRDIWGSIDNHLDINVFDNGGGVQATIYPVKDKQINTEHEVEHITSENIEIINLFQSNYYEQT
tara:strand:+ start:175 stop:429 length:255 start_codon:yes stop_codon:yes gene_type:complete